MDFFDVWVRGNAIKLLIGVTSDAEVASQDWHRAETSTATSTATSQRASQTCDMRIDMKRSVYIYI